MSTTYGTIQFRRSTAAQATADNVVLNVGEPGYETDTGKLKIGDGSTAWNSLQYAFVPGGSSASGITAAAVNGSGHLIITKSDSTTLDAGAVVGPAGPTGPTGPTGPNGTAGATGATGKGITALTINSQGHLVATLSDSSTLDGGAFPGRYRIAYTGSAWPARPSGLPAGMAEYDPNGYSGAPNPTDQTQGDRLGVLSSS